MPPEDKSKEPSPLLSPRKDRKIKLTAGLLALFTGGLGIHKFYLRQYGLGFLYLIFSSTMIPLVAGIIEGIVILSMSDERFDEKYNSVTPIVAKHPKRTAAFLAFFLGCFGAHKFYLRDTGWGVVYLLATLTGFYLTWQAMDASGIFQQVSQLVNANVDPQRIVAMMDTYKFNTDGLLLPNLLGLIPTIAGIVDGIMLLNMSNEQFEIKYKIKD